MRSRHCSWVTSLTCTARWRVRVTFRKVSLDLRPVSCGCEPMVKVPGGTRTKPGGMPGASEVPASAEPAADPFAGVADVATESGASVAVSGSVLFVTALARSPDSSAVRVGHAKTPAIARSDAMSTAASRIVLPRFSGVGDVDCPVCQGASVAAGGAFAVAGEPGAPADDPGVGVATGTETANLSLGETRLRRDASLCWATMVSGSSDAGGAGVLAGARAAGCGPGVAVGSAGNVAAPRGNSDVVEGPPLKVAGACAAGTGLEGADGMGGIEIGFGVGDPESRGSCWLGRSSWAVTSATVWSKAARSARGGLGTGRWLTSV